MDLQKNLGHIDRSLFQGAHNNTVFCQPLFQNLSPDEIQPNVFAYGPCWAALDPGMILEAHHHPVPELYIFVSGEGRMRLNEEWFDVQNGTAVNIPSNVEHEVTNPSAAIHPLIWISIGLNVES
ncbi:MAG: cupin domain-containing protein [bacterium]|nr:cupin domain-containing protein [bacterium]